MTVDAKNPYRLDQQVKKDDQYQVRDKFPLQFSITFHPTGHSAGLNGPKCTKFRR